MIDRHVTASPFLPAWRRKEASDRWIDPARPTSARIHDCLLGGKDNFAADRETAARIREVLPDADLLAQEGRAFALRAARFCAAEVGQIVELGPGIPVPPDLDEVARTADPEVTVVGVDIDPVVLAYGRALRPGAEFVWGDVRDPERIVHALRPFVDFDRPFALMATSLLHYLPENPRAILGVFRTLMVPGSLLVVSHGADDGTAPETLRALQEIFDETACPAVFRTPGQISALFDGLEFVRPGLVDVQQWRPDGEPGPPSGLRVLGGVGRVPR
ncbi:SAM-dependent methyltransferase [Sphaerisporangium melleum]|uniref:SAM-dependent methyltransferase n=1 Tax=Sphaerisporangium melleum TaxID=321316 RepID=A0A917QYT4_9ACTN|nr:SAM-dependent methyltransferase [Sphaerisporangium melleum]GGK75748.1 SAM-dependent methyltransferase [Sphaerisporangium melleum]GII72668.1 SAM-dependent methyltransferase [Sphaerisporangium melleum]